MFPFLRPISEVYTCYFGTFESVTHKMYLSIGFLVIGGLLSAHLLSQRAGMDLEPGWPCSGPLLQLAVEFADRILPGSNLKLLES